MSIRWPTDQPGRKEGRTLPNGDLGTRKKSEEVSNSRTHRRKKEKSIIRREKKSAPESIRPDLRFRCRYRRGRCVTIAGRKKRHDISPTTATLKKITERILELNNTKPGSTKERKKKRVYPCLARRRKTKKDSSERRYIGLARDREKMNSLSGKKGNGNREKGGGQEGLHRWGRLEFRN